MPPSRQFTRIDTVELKSQIFRKLGRQKAEKYFYNLKRLLSLKLNKLEFDKLCCSMIGRENVALHNLFIRSIIANACLSQGPPCKQASSGHSRNTKIPSALIGDLIPASARKGRSVTSRERRFGDRPSPLGPYGKGPPGNAQDVTKSCDLLKSREQQTAPEVISIGSKALLGAASVEDGEEVEQAESSPGVQSRSPVRPPLGITASVGGFPRMALRKGSAAGFHLCKSNVPQTCRSSAELPDTRTLMKRLEHKLELEGLGLSVDCANLLNNGSDAFMKRLIKPCMDLARSRRNNERMGQVNGNLYHAMSGLWHEESLQRSGRCYSASLLDFQVSMESNPQLLGVDWPVQLEKISLHQLEE